MSLDIASMTKSNSHLTLFKSVKNIVANFYLIIFTNNMSALRMPKNNPLAAKIFQLLHATEAYSWNEQMKNGVMQHACMQLHECLLKRLR